MADVIRDGNRVPGLLGASSSDGITPTTVYVDPTTHRLYVDANISVVALPTGASTSLKQSDGSQKTQIVDGTGNVIGATSNALDVNIKSGASSGAVAQGSTTSGQTGGLTQAAVTTAAPLYTTSQTSPLSLTLSGALRTDSSAVTQPVSLATNTPTLQAGSTTAVTQATAASLNATVVGTGTFATQAAQSGTWNITNISGTVSLPTGAATAAKQPALGTAGSASTDVITIQGVASMTKLLVTPDSVALPANQSVNMSQINGVTPLMNNGVAGTGSQRVTIASDNSAVSGFGVGATGATVPANAEYVAGVATTALPTAATAGNTTGAMVDKFGRQVIINGTLRDLVGTQSTTISASTAETTIVTAGGAGVFNDLVMLIISNTSASTSTRIDFRDTTAGTILFSLQSVGGAAPMGFSLTRPVPQTSANTNWTATCATSTTDVRIYAVYEKNK